MTGLPSPGVTARTARRRASALLTDIADEIAARKVRLAVAAFLLTLAAIAVATYPAGVWLLNVSQGVTP